MAHIKAIGFDMDHTLAVYRREQFEALAFRETLNKFIEAGYPEELSRLKFDPNFLIRGLLVDMDRGNLLKVDGHKYVKIAFHGKKRLTKDLRHKLYNNESFRASALLSVDTFFALSEVQLFTEIVDYMDRYPEKIRKSYREVYQDLRKFIDLSHADGSIKKIVLKNLDQYINKDKYLASTLRHLVDGGKSLFLLTNSDWSYTNNIMTYLLDEGSVSWREYFDVIIVSSCKPGFFTGTQPFYEVILENGYLKNHDGKFKQGTIYQGGNAQKFQEITGIRGDEILYIGDHIYGDILRSKNTVNWRTMLILEELESELVKIEELKEGLEEIKKQIKLREMIDEELHIIRSKIAYLNRQEEKLKGKGETKKAFYLSKEAEKLVPTAEQKQFELSQLDTHIRSLIEHRHDGIHPIWGELMKVGLERSRFADQVAEYACIYTSRLSNLRFYSPFKRFTSTHDLMPHEL
jgi:5'-nucleotidase